MSSRLPRSIAWQRFSRTEIEAADRFAEALLGARSPASEANGELEDAERFYAELMGRASPDRRSRWLGEDASTTPATTASCIRPDRDARFAAGVTLPQVLSFPHAAICKILVLRRVGPLSGLGIVDSAGNPVERPEGDRPNDDDPPGPWRRIGPTVMGLIQGEGTGFYVRPDRIVTAAHVVLGATDVVVIPGKNGPGVAPAGATHSNEPFGRMSLPASAVRVFPRALRVATRPSLPPDAFFVHDLAVLRPVPPPPGQRARPSALGHFTPSPPPAVGECVDTSGYSAETVDRNLQHTDIGVCTRRRGGLVDYDLMSEKGASGSPIWKGPFVPSTPGALACGIVLGGATRYETFSLVFDAGKLAFIRR